MISTIKECLQDNADLALKLKSLEQNLVCAADQVIECFERGGKLIFIGNGGSAADAMHITTEYVSRFYQTRKSLPAVSLTANIAIITAIANDYSFEDVFSRQLESAADINDLVVALSTSGESKNIIKALQYCDQKQIKTLSFTGDSDNSVARLSGYCIKVPSRLTPRVQEGYLLFNHIICQVVEDYIMNKS